MKQQRRVTPVRPRSVRNGKVDASDSRVGTSTPAEPATPITPAAPAASASAPAASTSASAPAAASAAPITPAVPATSVAPAAPAAPATSPDGSANPEANGTPEVAKPVNPFSREALRLDNNYGSLLKTEDHQHSIPVDKPPAEVWFRVNPDPDFVFDTFLLHLKNGADRGAYQISADVLPLLVGERQIKPMRLVLVIDRQGELRLWPLRLPGQDGREDGWMSSALEIAEQAKHRWTRMFAGASAFKSQTTRADIPEPIWPSKTFDEWLNLAFAKRRIASVDDPILRRLREGV
jgi:hypothetical protein